MNHNLKRILMPGAMLGAFMISGATALAFSPGGFSLDAFSNFSEEQQSAIEEAHMIMEEARQEADGVLEEAGVDRESMQEAMHSYHDTRHQAVEQALEDGDYEAFAELVADTPLGEKLNEEIFNKLVEIHELKEAGDHEGARDLAQSLRDDYDIGPGLMLGEQSGSGQGPHMGHGHGN